MSGSIVYPVTYSQPVQTIIPAYAYGEYSDDDNITTFFDVANILTQQYVSFFYDLNLPIYTSPLIVGSLLDWVINGIYGLPRSLIQVGTNEVYGVIDTFPLDALVIDGYRVLGRAAYNLMSDDTYRRVLTWHFYKGDGQQFTVKWLKRRIARFIYTTNLVGTGVDDTSMVSITLKANNVIGIGISSSNPNAAIFQQLLIDNLLELPFQYTYILTVTPVAPPTGSNWSTDFSGDFA